MPLIAAYAGLRLEEICQLDGQDVVFEDGVWCLNVRHGDGKRLKSESAERFVPIHDHLSEWGLIEYARARPKRELLFPELKPGGRYGSPGANFSKWFTRYRRNVGFADDSRDFHALRHTFNTELARKGVPDAMRSYLLGHAQQGLANTVYFGGFRPSDVAEAVNQLKFL